MSEAISSPVLAESSERAPPAGESMKARTLRGSMWTIAGFAASNVIRLANNLILTRLLAPEVFGQMALVYIFIQGLRLFSDVGTGPAVIQSSRGDDPRFLNTAWTVQSIRGAILWIATWIVARPVATFYEQPLLAVLIPAAGFGCVLEGLTSLSVQTAQRHLRLGRMTLVELGSQTIGIVASVVFVLIYRALHGADHGNAAWAIVGGGLVSNVTRLTLSHTVLPGIRHRFLLDRASASVLYSFGRWVFISTILTFLAGQTDRMVFGKLIPIDLLGVYGIGLMFATMPTEAVAKLGGLVAFPAFSRVADRPDFGQLFWRVRWPLLIAGATIVTGLIASGPFLIRILYDDRYVQAGWILQYLAVMAWFQIMESSNSAAVLAQGRVIWIAAGNAAKLVALLSLIPAGFHLGGFRGALVALILSEVLKYTGSTVAVSLRGFRNFGRELGLSLLIAGFAFAAVKAGGAAAHGPRANLVGFLVAGTTTVALWCPIALWIRFRRIGSA
jgi:O-antigen/teichoic acid export membrane protein